MIDFNVYKYFSSSVEKGDKEACDSYSNDIKGMLGRQKTSNFFLGAKLIDFFRSQTYNTAEDIIKLDMKQFKEQFGFERPIGVSNRWSGYFFAYCLKYFNLERSKVSRLMNVVDEFGDGFRDFQEKWKPFAWSQLVEMLSLLPLERNEIKPDWTIKQIREYKLSLKVKKEVPDTPATAEPKDERYERFSKWTRKQLCDKIFDLENDYKAAFEELEKLKTAELEHAKQKTEQPDEDFPFPRLKRGKISAIV